MKSPCSSFGIITVAIIFALLCTAPVHSNTGAIPELILDFPIFDGPFNWANGYTFPSMNQSLNFSKNFYQYTHLTLQNHFENEPYWQSRVSIAAFDILAIWLPLGSSWLHEEWHRAVMSNKEVESYNEVYKFDLFSKTIAVTDVKDNDLVRFKRDHPAEFVRLHVAGIESGYELNFALEKDKFFFGTETQDDLLLWLNYANNIAYIFIGSSSKADDITGDIIEDEGTDISERDFTGLDVTAWVYDLFRSDEPYEARGTHPSGVGIDRYISYSDLSDDEKDFLKKQRILSLLNLLDPFLVSKPYFIGTNPFNEKQIKWNFTVRHHLTSFGYCIGTNLFFQQDQYNLLTSFRLYSNRSHSFPGFGLELLRFPADLFSKTLSISSRIELWLQPEEQAFQTSSSEPGGLISLKTAYPLSKNIESYIEIEGKTDGWVAGNVYLDDNFSVRIGITWKILPKKK